MRIGRSVLTTCRAISLGLFAGFLALHFIGARVSADDAPTTSNQDARRPNVLWIVVEDQSRHYGFNGEKLVDTPMLDALASGGVRFTHAFVTAPICSTARSALITGMHQTSIGAHHHRSGRGEKKIHLPEHVRLAPALFRDAGYYTSIGSIGDITSPRKGRAQRLGKTDYNFAWDAGVYQAADWSKRKPGQPFFAQVMLAGGKARGKARAEKSIPHVAASDVTLPPYYPPHPDLLEDWAAYLDTFTLMDRQVAEIVKRLKAEGEFERTVIFFLTDHGVSHARGKQYCYDEGTRVPLLVHAPGLLSAATRDDLVSHIDVTATSLQLAGIAIPEGMEGRPLFGADHRPREFVVSARDRADETYDRIRSVRTSRYRYIRNGYPRRPHLQPNVYKDNRDNYVALRDARTQGMLNALQEKLLFSPTRPPEELYDLKADPWEVNNLANDPQHRNVLEQMRQTLDQWIQETGDRGQEVEPMAMYDSDMKTYLDQIGKRRPERAKLIQANIDLMKMWWREGR